ncbi:MULTISPECIES: acyl carrier protein [unclassified Streptomyces]|jgi:act minimal PKS acyl carrier protein|uniref:acyl carrier protein n=1 Tax=unclassified Streptomyces TaxID=2593676 RepID=UPI002DD9C769|nr:MULTISPECIES: acyl carrier protein [unclassified Streptomyces]WRZ36906.1 acyl carrier protein [Streptomyces sp. NBC_00151]WRZ44670.1 acyl carrier protein [Streptomyces sp. NBC_00151]WSP44062.1 acyl carrier protein [Streptomyces sp. NBC_01244]
MATKAFTLDDLKRILKEAAGVAEGVDLDGDILDTEFDVLGYESLALLEAGSLIERECGISLDEEAVNDAHTPRTFIDVVNMQLAPATAA